MNADVQCLHLAPELRGSRSAFSAPEELKLRVNNIIIVCYVPSREVGSGKGAATTLTWRRKLRSFERCLCFLKSTLSLETSEKKCASFDLLFTTKEDLGSVCVAMWGVWVDCAFAPSVCETNEIVGMILAIRSCLAAALPCERSHILG